MIPIKRLEYNSMTINKDINRNTITIGTHGADRFISFISKCPQYAIASGIGKDVGKTINDHYDGLSTSPFKIGNDISFP